MGRSKYNRSGAGAGRGNGDGRSVYVGGRDGSGGGRGGVGERGDNHYEHHHQGQYQTAGGGGDGGRRRGGRGRRDGTQMGTNPSPAQPWGYRPVQGGQGGSQMGTNSPPAQPWGRRPVQGSQGQTQRPQSAMGQGAGSTGGRGAWSGGTPHVAGRGSSAPAVGGGAGAGAGEATRRVLYVLLFLFLFLSLKLTHHSGSPLLHVPSLSTISRQFTMLLRLLPIGDEWRCSLLLQLHHLRLHWTIRCTVFTPS